MARANGTRSRGDLASFTAEPAESSTWTGIERADRVVLEEALSAHRLVPSSFHTGVYCGCIPSACMRARGSLSSGALEGIYCLRVDLVVCHRGEWLAVEVKPELSIESIGQAVVYRHLMPIWYPELGGIKGAVLCSRSRKELRMCATVGAGLVVISGHEVDEVAGDRAEK